jgi:hypothetical protein
MALIKIDITPKSGNVILFGTAITIGLSGLYALFGAILYGKF